MQLDPRFLGTQQAHPSDRRPLAAGDRSEGGVAARVGPPSDGFSVADGRGWTVDLTASESGGARFEVRDATVSDGDGQSEAPAGR